MVSSCRTHVTHRRNILFTLILVVCTVLVFLRSTVQPPTEELVPRSSNEGVIMVGGDYSGPSKTYNGTDVDTAPSSTSNANGLDQEGTQQSSDPRTHDGGFSFDTFIGNSSGIPYRVRNDRPEIWEQINSYRYEPYDGLIVHLDIVTQARGSGSPMCNYMRALQYHPAPTRKTPSFACKGATPTDKIDPNDAALTSGAVLAKHGKPWYGNTTIPIGKTVSTNGYYDETDINIHFLIKYYHMMVQEFNDLPSRAYTAETRWEHPQLVSLLVMQDPMDRITAHIDAHYNLEELGADKYNETLWNWVMDESNAIVNNFALRIMTEKHDHKSDLILYDVTNAQLGAARDLLQRFTLVLDQDCLDDSLRALGDLMGYQVGKLPTIKSYTIEQQRELLGVDLYQYLLSKNQFDVELYQWSKSMSLVACGD